MKIQNLLVTGAAIIMSAACDSNDAEKTPEEQAWTALSEWSSKHSDFDPGTVPATLAGMNMIICSDEYLFRNGDLYKGYENRNEQYGWRPLRIVFSEDGTCRNYYFDEFGRWPKDEPYRYMLFTWSYDESTSVITTEYCGEHPNFRSPMRAQVKAVGDGRIVLDGNLCGSANIFGPVEETGGYGFYPDYGIYLRMSLYAAPDETRRPWLETAVCDNPL